MSTLNEAARIEELLRDLPSDSNSTNALMYEHLEEARFCLLGSMLSEYQLALNLARQLLPDIEDENLRQRIGDFLREQKSSGAPTR